MATLLTVDPNEKQTHTKKKKGFSPMAGNRADKVAMDANTTKKIKIRDGQFGL